MWVAVRESTSIAFAIAGPSRDPGAGDATGELWAIYAAPGAWGAGVGPALLARAMRWLRAQGYEDGRLWVLRHNHRAERFYRRYGWRPDGTTFRFRIDGYPLVERRYRRRLTPRA